MTVHVKSFPVQNWAITPVPFAIGETVPTDIRLQRWQLVLTGVMVVDFQGNNPHDWNRDTLNFFPDIQAPLNFVLQSFGITQTPDTTLGFNVLLWAPFVVPSSVFSRESGTVDAGFAVDAWRPLFASGQDAITNTKVTHLYNSFDADLAVRNNQATLHRVSYHLQLAGRLAFLEAI